MIVADRVMRSLCWCWSCLHECPLLIVHTCEPLLLLHSPPLVGCFLGMIVLGRQEGEGRVMLVSTQITS